MDSCHILRSCIARYACHNKYTVAFTVACTVQYRTVRALAGPVTKLLTMLLLCSRVWLHPHCCMVIFPCYICTECLLRQLTHKHLLHVLTIQDRVPLHLQQQSGSAGPTTCSISSIGTSPESTRKQATQVCRAPNELTLPLNMYRSRRSTPEASTH